MNYHFTIKGNPAIKKNSRTIGRNRLTGRMFPMKNTKLQIAEKDAYYQLLAQKLHGFKIITEPIAVQFLFYRKDKRKVDLSNLYGFAEDVLQKARIIEDDFLIESHDGSRKRYDPKNPRTEITITPFVE